MATRFYINRNALAFSPTNFTPLMKGPWNIDTALEHTLETAPVGSTSALRTVSTGANTSSTCHAICTSHPLSAAFTFDGTVTWRANFRCKQETDANTFFCICIAVVDNDGNLKDVGSALITDDLEMTTGTSYVEREIAATVQTGLSITTVPGDRIQIEIGWDKGTAVSSVIGVAYQDVIGDPDLSGDGGTTADNPWIECSLNLTFDAEGTTYGVTNTNQLMMMGVGT